MRWRIGGTLVAALSMALGACGGDDGDRPDPAADQDLVDAVVLRLDDLPDGFQQERADDDDNDEGADECLQSELGLTRAEFEDARTARSDALQYESESVSIRARANAFEDADIPGDVMDSFDTDGFLDCLRASFDADPAMSEFEITSLTSLDPLAGDEATAYHLQLLLTSQGIDVESRLTALLVDRFVVSIEATGFEGGIDDDVLRDALETMADRVDAER